MPHAYLSRNLSALFISFAMIFRKADASIGSSLNKRYLRRAILVPAAELEKKCGEGFPIIPPPLESRSISSSCGGYQIDAMEIAATSIQIPFLRALYEGRGESQTSDGFIVDCSRFAFRGVENELLIADICNAAGDD